MINLDPLNAAGILLHNGITQGEVDHLGLTLTARWHIRGVDYGYSETLDLLVTLNVYSAESGLEDFIRNANNCIRGLLNNANN